MNREMFGNLPQRKEELIQKIQELDAKEAMVGLSEHHRIERNEATGEFEVAIQEEIDWRQKS